MKLSALAAKPALIKLVLDDEEIVKEFNEPLEFYIYDRQPIDVFIKFAALDSTNFGEMVRLVNDIILDEDGSPIISNDMVLPRKLYIKVVEKVVSRLGE